MTEDKLISESYSSKESYIDSKLTKIQDDVQDIKLSLVKMELTLERNTADVEKHIRRSDAQEEQVKALKDEVLPILPEIKQMVRYWKLLSIIVIMAVTSSNPALIPVIFKLFGLASPVTGVPNVP